ncbi:MAG: hypothetical protein SPK63_00495 [Eubacteriales bacterium]|nr:hypothetical protein [Eubacteriales bacterium]
MMEDLDDFSQNLLRYRVLDNKTNNIATISFDKFSATKIINIDPCEYIIYGYILVNVKNPTTLKFYYNNILLYEFNESETRIIPCVFEGTPVLKIQGECAKCDIQIYGAKPQYQNKIFVNEHSKHIVFDRGKTEIYSYTANEDVKNGNLTFVRSIENCIDANDFEVSSKVYCGQLTIENNDLYLYTDMNNYNSKILIKSGVKDARIIDYESNQVMILYIVGSLLCYKLVDKDCNVSQEVTVTLGSRYMPKSIGMLSTTIRSPRPIVSVNCYDGSTLMLIINSTGFDISIVKKGDFSKLYVNGSNIELYAFVGNMLSISKFTYSSSTGLAQVGTAKNIWNVNDISKVGDKYLIYNNKFLCGEFGYDDL